MIVAIKLFISIAANNVSEIFYELSACFKILDQCYSNSRRSFNQNFSVPKISNVLCNIGLKNYDKQITNEHLFAWIKKYSKFFSFPNLVKAWLHTILRLIDFTIIWQFLANHWKFFKTEHILL